MNRPLLLLLAAFNIALIGGCASTAPPKMMTQLMFEGQAEEAITFYTSLFDDAEIIEIERYGPDQLGPEGTVARALFTIKGQTLACIDSPADHPFTFTPAISFFVECDSEAEINRLHAQLSAQGLTLMPLQEYPFSPRFTWVQDRFGVSWQLNLGPIESVVGRN